MMQKLMTRITIAQIIMMLMLINMVLIVEYDKDFGKIKFELILQILMVGFNGILDIGQIEDLQMIKYKLLDGRKQI